MPTAYIFVNCLVGDEEEIIREISKVPEIKEIRGTYGVHDIFVKVRADNSEVMNNVIAHKIRRTDGITSTLTLLAIEEEGGK